MKKKSTILSIIMFLFSLLFLYTGISKFYKFHESLVSLRVSLIIGPLARFIAVAMPALEIIVALSFFVPRLEKLALKTSLAMMIVFTLYVGYLVLFAKSIPCSCGGIMHQMTWKQHLVFNIFFTSLAVWGLKLMKQRETAQSEGADKNYASKPDVVHRAQL